jgi:hypothetical protein
MKLTLLLLTLAIGLTLHSCNSDSSNDNPSPSAIAINVPDNTSEALNYISGTDQKIWMTESFDLEMFGMLDCREDDTFTFFSDGTYQYDGGALLCGDSDNSQIKTGVWELDLPNRIILFDKNTENEAKAALISLEESRIRVRGSWNSLIIDAIFETLN